MKKMQKKDKRIIIQVLLVLGFAVLCALLYFSLKSESSFFNLYLSSSKNKAMEEEIKGLNKTIDSLKETIEKLKTDTSYVERIAREKLGMARKGEKVFKFVDEEK